MSMMQPSCKPLVEAALQQLRLGAQCDLYGSRRFPRGHIYKVGLRIVCAGRNWSPCPWKSNTVRAAVSAAAVDIRTQLRETNQPVPNAVRRIWNSREATLLRRKVLNEGDLTVNQARVRTLGVFLGFVRTTIKFSYFPSSTVQRYWLRIRVIFANGQEIRCRVFLSYPE